MSDLSAYPVLFFLHTVLATPTFLQDLLSSPFPLKLCKAWLHGYASGNSSTVILSCENFGEWEAEPKVIGVVFKVTCQREEDLLRQYAGPGVEVEDVQFELRKGSALFGVKDWARGKAFIRKDVGGEILDENSAEVPNLGKEECDIFEALRIEHDSLNTPKKDPANAEHEAFITSVDAGLRTSGQKQDPKTTLDQQWDFGQPLTRLRTGNTPAVFIIGAGSEECSSGANTETHTASPTPAIRMETEHSQFFTPTGMTPDIPYPADSLSFITSHPSVEEASQISSRNSQTPLVRPQSALQVTSHQSIDAPLRPMSVTNHLKTSWSSRSLLEKMGIRSKEKPVQEVDGGAAPEMYGSPGQVKGVRSLVAVFEKLKK